MIRFSAYRLLKWRRAALAAVCVLACTDPVPTAPKIDLRLARGGPGGGPTVKSTNPSSGTVSTTLSVQVFGSGFEPGSRAVWALNGDTTGTVTKVKTNSTTFVSSTELIASITIGSDASLDVYDVVVITPLGKKGIGIELFTVTATTVTAIAPKGVDGEADAVNDVGQVVGLTGPPGSPGRRSFLWTPTQPRGTTGTWRYLDGGTAASINNAGFVVGGMTVGGTPHPGLWSAAHGWQDLGNLSNGINGFAKDISESGMAAGYGDSGGEQRAIVWAVSLSADGAVISSTPTDLGTVPGGGGSVGLSIDATGTYVSGWAHPSAAEPNHPAIWTRAGGSWTIRQLPLLSGSTGGTAWGVNRYGQSVGTSNWPQSCQLPVIWDSDGTVRALPLFSDGCQGEAYSINDAGQVVGRADSRRLGVRAVMWTVNGASISGPRDLGTLAGYNLAGVLDVSSNIGGLVQLAGFGQNNSGRWAPTLWSAR